MIRIVLSDEQAQAVQSAKDRVELRDERGKLVGYVSRATSEDEVSEARRRLKSDGPWLTTAQILAQLDSLE